MKTLVVIPGERVGWSMWIGEKSPHILAGGVLRSGIKEVKALLSQYCPTRLVVQDQTQNFSPDLSRASIELIYRFKHIWTISAELHDCYSCERQPGFHRSVVEKRLHVRCETPEEKLTTARTIKEILGTSERIKEALPDVYESEAILLGYASAYEE